MKTPVRVRSWKLVLAVVGVWLALLAPTHVSYGQDYFGPGAVWKLKAGYPQADKNFLYMISVGGMQVSPGQLTTNLGGAQGLFTFKSPPDTLVVGQSYTVSLQGVSSSGPYHKIPSARMYLGQACTSKYAGAGDGDRTHQRNEVTRSVAVAPPPYKTELSYPNNDPKQLLTVSHSDELSFQFQPKISGFESDRTFAFTVAPDAGQNGICAYTYLYEPFSPAPATGTGNSTGTGLVPPPVGPTRSVDGQPQPVVPPGRDIATLLLQILAVLLGTGLAWLFPSLIQRLIDLLSVKPTPPPSDQMDTTPIGPGPAGLISVAILSGAPRPFEPDLVDDPPIEKRCRKLKDEYDAALDKYRGIHTIISQIDSLHREWKDLCRTYGNAIPGLTAAQKWLAFYYVFGWTPQKLFESLRKLVETLTGADMVINPIIGLFGAMSVGKTAELISALTGLKLATVQFISGGFSLTSAGLGVVAYAGTSKMPGYAASIQAQVAKVESVLAEMARQIQDLKTRLQGLAAQHRDAGLYSEQRNSYQRVMELGAELQLNCPKYFLSTWNVPMPSAADPLLLGMPVWPKRSG